MTQTAPCEDVHAVGSLEEELRGIEAAWINAEFEALIAANWATERSRRYACPPDGPTGDIRLEPDHGDRRSPNKWPREAAADNDPRLRRNREEPSPARPAQRPGIAVGITSPANHDQNSLERPCLVASCLGFSREGNR